MTLELDLEFIKRELGILYKDALAHIISDIHDEEKKFLKSDVGDEIQFTVRIDIHNHIRDVKSPEIILFREYQDTYKPQKLVFDPTLNAHGKKLADVIENTDIKPLSGIHDDTIKQLEEMRNGINGPRRILLIQYKGIFDSKEKAEEIARRAREDNILVCDNQFDVREIEI